VVHPTFFQKHLHFVGSFTIRRRIRSHHRSHYSHIEGTHHERKEHKSFQHFCNLQRPSPCRDFKLDELLPLAHFSLFFLFRVRFITNICVQSSTALLSFFTGEFICVTIINSRSIFCLFVEKISLLAS
jgi:hypothetical protein